MDKLTAAINISLSQRLIVGVAISAGLIDFYGVFMKYSFFAQDAGLLRAASQRGITLIEILLAVAIIAFLATMVAADFFWFTRSDKVNNAKAGTKMIASVASRYFVDTKHVARSMEDLLSNPKGIVNWKGPYLTPSQALDPWRNRYSLQSPGQHGELDVISFGEDGREGGSGRNADIGNWQ